MYKGFISFCSLTQLTVTVAGNNKYRRRTEARFYTRTKKNFNCLLKHYQLFTRRNGSESNLYNQVSVQHNSKTDETQQLDENGRNNF